MQDYQPKPESPTPADIAKETFRRLAMRRIAPTPDAYQKTYNEIAGIQGRLPAEKVLADFSARLTEGSRDLVGLGAQLANALERRDWQNCSEHLSQLIDRHLKRPAGAVAEKSAPTTALLPPNEKTDGKQKSELRSSSEISETPFEQQIGHSQADEQKPPTKQSASVTNTLTSSSAAPRDQILDSNKPSINDLQMARIARGMLVRTLTLAVSPLVQEVPGLSEEVEALADAIGATREKDELAALDPRLKDLCYKVEMKSGDLGEEREMLLRLFKLLVENIGELVEDDSWLSGQMSHVQNILSDQISYATLLDATRSLKEVIYKQSMLKHSLADAKEQVKGMMITVADRLGEVATSTGTFQKKMEGYVQTIGTAKGIPELHRVMDSMIQDTRIAHIEAVRTHDDMVNARKEVQAAESRIQELESQLVQMSELAYEDQLTGSLNRRGLDEVLEREVARSVRRKSPLCISMVDLDNFKKLNDTYGHDTGDGALVHLVRVVKDTLRTMDIIARFGGEEFMIVLPDTALEDAVNTVTRVQRELTKSIFMNNNERLLITFSAGVALHEEGEDTAAMIKRADEAMYKAKKSGKNRVVAASPATLTFPSNPASPTVEGSI